MKYGQTRCTSNSQKKITNKSRAIKMIDFNIRKAKKYGLSPYWQRFKLSVLFSVVSNVFSCISILMHFISKIKNIDYSILQFYSLY